MAIAQSVRLGKRAAQATNARGKIKAYLAWGALLALGVGWSLVGACGGGASCGDACNHYLTCKGADASNQSQCVSLCEQTPAATPDWLDGYVKTDCGTAVSIIDGNGIGGSMDTSGGAGNGAGNGAGAGAGGGCYPDGHTCSAGGDCCNGNCIDMSVGQWICY